MTTSPVAEPTDPPLSTAIREASAGVHHAAERSPLVRLLLRGELPIEGYVALVGQHLHLYRALEDAARAVADDPVAGPFVDPALDRAPALAADLAHLAGARGTEDHPPLPATAAYAAHLAALAATWPPGLVAHHYVRYLGDLSGGRMIARVAARAYGVAPGAGGDFYAFDGIDDVDVYKDAYRARLDSLPLDGDERERFTTEVMAAFAGTGAVYDAIYATLG